MMNISKGLWPEHTYSEEDWNPITMEEALQNPGLGYSGMSPYYGAQLYQLPFA